jgi:pSer/pThr/pTyr-binding forkhead associated (FHA) protein
VDDEKTLPGLAVRPLGDALDDQVLPDGISAALRVLEGPGKGDLVPIRGALQVGRGDGNGLVIVDRNVSTLHAMIEPAGRGKFRIRDLESRNGTFVNGERVTDRLLEDGDVLVLGSAVLKFRSTGRALGPEIPGEEKPPTDFSSSSRGRRFEPPPDAA